MSPGNIVKQVTDTLLRTIADRIGAEMHPEQIFLFGSHAWGAPQESSDIDLFVVVADSDQPAYRRAREAYRCLRGLGAPVEIIVQTRAEVERSKKVATSLARKVLEQGKIIYG